MTKIQYDKQNLKELLEVDAKVLGSYTTFECTENEKAFYEYDIQTMIKHAEMLKELLFKAE